MTLEVVDPTAVHARRVDRAGGSDSRAKSSSVRLDGEPVPTRELGDLHGTRLQLFETAPGIIEIDYPATVVGRAPAAPSCRSTRSPYLRPSRYVQSDTLSRSRARRSPGSAGADLRRAPSASGCTTGCATSPERRRRRAGRSRPSSAAPGSAATYAHLTAALLRGLDVPARLVSVYAPQLAPPDFHAVVEALVDGRWVVVDATRLAPRRGLVRMATGRDATDTAFLTNTLADIDLRICASRRPATTILDRRPRRPGRTGLSPARRRARRATDFDDLGRRRPARRTPAIATIQYGPWNTSAMPDPVRRPRSRPRRRRSAPSRCRRKPRSSARSGSRRRARATETSMFSPPVWFCQRHATPVVGERARRRRSPPRA